MRRCLNSQPHARKLSNAEIRPLPVSSSNPPSRVGSKLDIAGAVPVKQSPDAAAAKSAAAEAKESKSGGASPKITTEQAASSAASTGSNDDAAPHGDQA